MGVWRSGFLPVGMILLVLGLGNWIIGLRKVDEYTRLLSRSERPVPVERFGEFRELSARTNSTLLRPFQGGSDTASLIEAKLDFYRIVNTGGRLLMLAGLFAATAGLVTSWYRRHTHGRDTLMTHPG